MGDNEAFYVAWNHGIKEAVNSCKSLKEHNPDLRVSLACFEPIEIDCFDHVFSFAEREFSENKFLRKVELIYEFLIRSEAQRVLFLDTDTTIFGSVQPIFDSLDYAQLAMALAPVAMRNEGVPDSIATYNTGVMGVYCLYETVIRQWLEATRHNDDDQHAMRWLIHNAGLKIATLLPRYNFRPKFPAYLSGKPVIIHNRQGDNKKIFKRANKGHWKP